MVLVGEPADRQRTTHPLQRRVGVFTVMQGVSALTAQQCHATHEFACCVNIILFTSRYTVITLLLL
jgi:hypothetical protein